VIAGAVGRGLDWLIVNQAASGELASYASPLNDAETEWAPDSLKFISALVALACAEVDDPRAVSIVDRVVTFLRSEREDHALWRYWTSDNEQFGYTPPDADDTACCSMAVALRGDETAQNVRLLMANRDRRGRFHTWLIPHATSRSARYLWAVRDEFRKATRERRALLWENSEAFPDDVDGVVNANVIRYLGPERAPEEAVAWVHQLIRDGLEADCDSWHRNRFTMYSSVADAHRRGLATFARLGPVIIERIADRTVAGRGVGPSLDTAMALLAVQRFDGPSGLRKELRDSLLDRQLDDGSWERSVFYYGGPDEVFGWASEALSTAVAVQALHHEQRSSA
jgi:hypothetical protein